MCASSTRLGSPPDWIECAGAKAWARTQLPLEPFPSLGSSARSRFQQSIAEDEAQILRLEELIRRVQWNVQGLRNRISLNRARLAPIRLIPNETLSTIFLDWLDVRDCERSQFADKEYFVPPSTILKVCRRWAECAISTPTIWTRSKYVIDTSRLACLDRAKIFKNCFNRASSRNLKVKFGGCDDHLQADNIWCQVMEPSLPRMEDLTISGIGRTTNTFDALTDDWPDRKLVMSLPLCTQLSRLCLDRIDFPEPENPAPIVLPNVRSIKYEFCNGSPPIECPALVACDFQDCSLSHPYCLSLSSTSLFLTKMSLSSSYMYSENTIQPTFLSLEDLDIHYWEDGMPEWFSRMPNIQSISVYLLHDIVSYTVERIPLGSYSTLTSVSLTLGCSMALLSNEAVQVVHDWLFQARNLVEFELNFGPDDHGYFEKYGMHMYIDQLLTTKRNPPCFPRLKHLSITGDERLQRELLQLLTERASDAERVEAGFPVHGNSPGIIQRPCLLTIVNSDTLPDMKSVGLKEFLEICGRHAISFEEEEEEEEEETDDNESSDGSLLDLLA